MIPWGILYYPAYQTFVIAFCICLGCINKINTSREDCFKDVIIIDTHCAATDI